ncbi:MAG: AMP-binding protein [Vicingaceae bacterium]|nr:AMP-binding protein [Vicingaceae bacterium]
MEQSILDTILSNLTTYSKENAFYINEQFYTYSDLSQKVAGISEAIKEIPQQSTVGVITTDSIETYASIIALWLNGLIFIPVSPANAKDRNENSLKQAEAKHILTPTTKDAKLIDSANFNIIETSSLSAFATIENKNKDENNILYILFTSGSTGTPKGVPINLKNLDAFIHSFIKIGYEINAKDKFLQIYDLSFDASAHCYTLPLFLGACAYTIPPKEVKYLYAYKLMKKHELTFVKMPPSTLSYLKPYFPKINLPLLKYTCFGGEALQSSLVNDWKKCAPSTEIHNVYGPTEATINCFSYTSDLPKHYNNIVAIGKPMDGIEAIVINENNSLLSENKKGELCISGNQITAGYWKNELKNEESFIAINGKTYYKTGDIVYTDNEGDYFYCERLDNQVQIQGYRVELGELEHHSRNLTQLTQVVALAKKSSNNTNQLFLFLENYKGSIEELKIDISKKVPNYMVPQQIITIPSFPITTSGKIDRNQLKELLS